MGLDIYHLQATLNPPEIITPNNYYDLLFTESEFEDFDVDISYFKKYLQKVDYPVTLLTVILPKSKEKVEYVKEWFQKYNYPILFDENKAVLAEMIAHTERTYNLQNVHVHKWNSPLWKGIYYYIYEKKTGFYVQELGYQRKGMNGDFGKRFYNPQICNYTKKDDFDFAYNCIDFYRSVDTQEDVDRAKQNFKETFIDKYKEGASILSVSY